MKKVSDSELKTIELEILREVAAFCDMHDVRYYLVCGTALGAVRHDGFIPWDDDIDLGLPRPDYERFLSLFRSEKYTVLDSRFDDRYPYAFAKVSDNATCLVENIAQPFPMGVYIDLFPIDGLPANEAERNACVPLRFLSITRNLSSCLQGVFADPFYKKGPHPQKFL